MTISIVNKLRKMEGKEFNPMRPEPGELEKYEKVLGRALPADIRAVFSEWGGGTITFNYLTPLGTTHVSELIDCLDDDVYSQYLPGMIVVGFSGGEELYYYDPDNKLGGGEWALYIVEMGVLTLEDSRWVGSSFTDALERLLAGIEFMDGEKLSKKNE